MLFLWGGLIVALFFAVLYVIWGFLSPFVFPNYGPPYFFFQTNNPKNFIYIPGILLIAIVYYVLLMMLHSGKYALLKKVFKK
jgi:uncharacterized RDD family membrane protein YckC